MPAWFRRAARDILTADGPEPDRQADGRGRSDGRFVAFLDSSDHTGGAEPSRAHRGESCEMRELSLDSSRAGASGRRTGLGGGDGG